MDDLVTRFNGETREAVRDAIRKALLAGGSESEVEAGIVAAFEMLKRGGAKAEPAPDPWRAEVDVLQGTVKALLESALAPAPAPVITVTVPEPSVVVNVPAQEPPTVTIAEGAVALAVNIPEQKAVTRHVKRDPAGLITEITDG